MKKKHIKPGILVTIRHDAFEHTGPIFGWSYEMDTMLGKTYRVKESSTSEKGARVPLGDTNFVFHHKSVDLVKENSPEPTFVYLVCDVLEGVHKVRVTEPADEDGDLVAMFMGEETRFIRLDYVHTVEEARELFDKAVADTREKLEARLEKLDEIVFRVV